MATIKAQAFKIGFIQLGGTGAIKTDNLRLARTKVLQAAKGKDGKGKVDLVVLPVCLPLPDLHEANSVD